MATKIKIAELEIDDKALIKSTSDVKKAIDELKKSQKDLTDNNEQGSKQFVKNAADLKVLGSAYNANIKALAKRTQATADATAREEIMNEVLQQEVTSITEAREQNKLLNKLRNESNATTTEGQEEIRKLNNALDANNDFIKDNADQYLQQKINIGNYSESIKEAFNDINIFNGGISGFIGRAQQAGGVTNLLSKSIKSVTVAIGGMIKASLAFLATPIGAVIGAIGVVLAAFINYLKSTQSGIDAVTSVTRPLMAVFQSLIGVLQQVGEFLYKAFTEPKVALEGIYNYVKDKIIVQFKAFGKILEGIFTLDFSLVKEGFKDIAKNAENVLNDVANAGKQVGAFFADAIEKGKEIDQLTKDIEKSENALILLRATNLQQIKEQELIAKDRNKTEAERNIAVEEAIRLSEELATAEQSILDKKIKVKEIENSLNDTTRDDISEINKLKAERIQQDEQADARKLRFLGTQNQLQNEAVKKSKEIADAAIAQQQAELELFVQQQGVRAKTLQEQLDVAKQVYERESEILEAELKNRNITQTEYDAQLLALKNDLSQQQAEATVDAAQRELDAYIQNAQSKIDNEQYFSDESLRIENERLEAIAEKRREFTQTQLDEGVINQTQYNDAINAINEENRIALEDAQTLRDEAKKEKEIIDLENKMIIEEQGFQDAFDLESERLEIQRQQEVAAAEKSGADISLINQKYANAQVEIDRAKDANRLQLAASTFGQIAGILKEGTALAKFFGIAQATIDTYQAANLALSTLPPPFGAIQAGVSIATGLGNVAKIAGVKFAKGGISEIDGASHAQGGVPIYAGNQYIGEAEGGEGIGILNRSAYAGFMDFNNSYLSGQSRSGHYAGGGIITQAVRPSNNSDDIVSGLSEIISSQQIFVAVEDINTGQGNYADVVNTANL